MNKEQKKVQPVEKKPVVSQGSKKPVVSTVKKDNKKSGCCGCSGN